MNDNMVHDHPSGTEAVEGVVLVDGPDGVAVTLTPAAAAVTSTRLAHSASEARSQQRAKPRTEDGDTSSR